VSCSCTNILQLTELSAERYLTRLIRRRDIEDALKRLDKLTHEEARMATAQVLKATRNIDDRVRGVGEAEDQMRCLSSRANSGPSHVLIGNQLRENLRKWLSPSDPSINHNIACAIRHEGSAGWFLESSMFNDWKSTGSLLWINGKRAHLSRSRYTI
jgi:hypothetical protein